MRQHVNKGKTIVKQKMGHSAPCIRNTATVSEDDAPSAFVRNAASMARRREHALLLLAQISSSYAPNQAANLGA